MKILCQCYARSGRGGINAVVSARAIRILGIDPGLRRTGWGMIELAGRELGFLACGRIETNERESLARRLVTIHAGLAQVIAQFKPQEAAAEATFVNKDASATLKLGQARGVAILAAAAAGLPVAEYAPNLVKKTIVLLPRADPATEDAADALAIAITHAHHRSAGLARAQSEARRQAKAGESDKIAAKLGRGFFP